MPRVNSASAPAINAFNNLAQLINKRQAKVTPSPAADAGKAGDGKDAKHVAPGGSAAHAQAPDAASEAGQAASGAQSSPPPALASDQAFKDICSLAQCGKDEALDAIEALVHLSCWYAPAEQGKPGAAPEPEVSRQATDTLLSIYAKLDTPESHRDYLRNCLAEMFRFVAHPAAERKSDGAASQAASVAAPAALDPIPPGLLYLIGQSLKGDESRVGDVQQIKLALDKHLRPWSVVPDAKAGAKTPPPNWLRRDLFCDDAELFASPVWDQLNCLETFETSRRVADDRTAAVPLLRDAAETAALDNLIKELAASPSTDPHVALVSSTGHWVSLFMQRHDDGSCHALVVDTLAKPDGSRTDGSGHAGLGRQLADRLQAMSFNGRPLNVHRVFGNLQPGDMANDCGPLCLEVIRSADVILDRSVNSGSQARRPVIDAQFAQSLAGEIERVWQGASPGRAAADQLQIRMNPVMVARRAEMLEGRARLLAPASGISAGEVCDPEHVLETCYWIGETAEHVISTCDRIVGERPGAGLAGLRATRQVLDDLLKRAWRANTTLQKVKGQVASNAWDPGLRIKDSWQAQVHAFSEVEEPAQLALERVPQVVREFVRTELAAIRAKLEPLITELNTLDHPPADGSQSAPAAGADGSRKTAADRLSAAFRESAQEVAELLQVGAENPAVGEMAQRIADYQARAQKLAVPAPTR